MDREAEQAIELMPQAGRNVPSTTSETIDEVEVSRIFKLYDTNNDGFLDTKEIKDLITADQADEIRPSVVKKIFRRADENNDGRISYSEFLKMHKHHKWLLKEMSNQYIGIVPYQQNRHTKEMRPKHLPWLMVSLTCLQVAIFIYTNYWDTKDSFKNILRFSLDSKMQVWRFVSYMLVHSGIGHLLGNMVLQLLLGIPLEILNGWWRVLIVYLSGGIAGCLGHATFRDDTLQGASAGDYALLTAHIASVVINWQEFDQGLVHIFLSVVYCIISIIVAATDTGDSISNLAHFFGGLAGLLIGFCVLLNVIIKEWEITLKIGSFISFAVLMLIGVLRLYVFR